jgi:hypothetical protein
VGNARMPAAFLQLCRLSEILPSRAHMNTLEAGQPGKPGWKQTGLEANRAGNCVTAHSLFNLKCIYEFKRSKK